MNKPVAVITFAIILLMPVYANAQNSDRITLLDNFGDFKKGESLFIFGNVATVDPDSFLITQIVNPDGDLCQIQQILPLSNGQFLTSPIPLKGKVCGLSGEYTVKVFYGDHSKNSNFFVTTETIQENSGAEYFDAATSIVSKKIDSVHTLLGATPYSERYATIIASVSDNTISDLKDLYVDIWSSFFDEDELFDIVPKYRVPITTALDSTSDLLESGSISFDIAQEIDRGTFAAIFYSAINDEKNTLSELNNVYVSIANVDPTKVAQKKSLSFVEMEEIVLNLMTKSQSVMHEEVHEELALIFSRGTAPLYVDELNELIDLLTKSRFLDIASRNNSDLYRLLILDWENTRSSLMKQRTIDEFLAMKDDVDKLHQTVMLLRNLDNVDRFISSDANENSELANIILPEWKTLESDLLLATTVDEILALKTDIENMKEAIDISSRISKTVAISQETGVNADLVSEWELLLNRVESAESVAEIVDVVSDFEKTQDEIREKRNPLSVLEFEYKSLKTKAELQADRSNLILIDNALKIIDTAKNMQQGNPSTSRIDRIDVLLTWASAKLPEIKTDLYSYTKDASKIRASDILQRAKSIENLVDLGLRKNRFLPGYEDFTFSMKDRLNEARDLVIKDDFDSADQIVRALFTEWREISKAYADDPLGSDVGYSVDELKRIEYRKRLDTLTQMASTFHNEEFAPHSETFVKMAEKASEQIDLGNFLDADLQILEIRKFLTEKLIFTNAKIIYNISYDSEKDAWILDGFVDKELYNPYYVDDRRDELKVTIYDMDGEVHSELEFANTRLGKFFTQWNAPAEPGLYVTVLDFKGFTASQIVNVEEKIIRDYTPKELDKVDLAREYNELKIFIEEFGGKNFESNEQRFDSVMFEIEFGLKNNNSEKVEEKLAELENLIERYLPVRSRSAIIDVTVTGNQLHISGAVQKTVAFSEDLFVDIFDQRGDPIDEITIKDNPSGQFDQVYSKPYSPGVYVAQLQYHDLTVSDFFTIR